MSSQSTVPRLGGTQGLKISSSSSDRPSSWCIFNVTSSFSTVTLFGSGSMYTASIFFLLSKHLRFKGICEIKQLEHLCFAYFIKNSMESGQSLTFPSSPSTYDRISDRILLMRSVFSLCNTTFERMSVKILFAISSPAVSLRRSKLSVANSAFSLCDPTSEINLSTMFLAMSSPECSSSEIMLIEFDLFSDSWLLSFFSSRPRLGIKAWLLQELNSISSSSDTFLQMQANHLQAVHLFEGAERRVISDSNTFLQRQENHLQAVHLFGGTECRVIPESWKIYYLSSQPSISIKD